jgi:hypothetical protein
MTTKSESITNLALALCNVQKEMVAVPMDSTNPYYKSRYASLGAVIETSRPILAKNSLAIAQFPATWISGEVGLTTILVHSSGEWIEETISIKLSEDAKNPAQDAGKAITYLRRYGWAAVLGMYAEEDTDGEGLTPTASVTKVQAGKPPVVGNVWKPEILTGLFETGGFQNTFEMQNALKLSKELKPGVTGLPGLIFWKDHYKRLRIEEQLEPKEAAEAADFEYVAEKNRKAQDAATEKAA